jgi:hypothetical protein
VKGDVVSGFANLNTVSYGTFFGGCQNISESSFIVFRGALRKTLCKQCASMGNSGQFRTISQVKIAK